MAMAQNPESTEHDGMPRSAIATGLVDFVLPPAEMPAQLIAYVTHAFGKPPQPASPTHPKTEVALKKIFVLLRAQTGHDFSQYKQNTVNRRVERRMAVHRLGECQGRSVCPGNNGADQTPTGRVRCLNRRVGETRP
jgi:two-component system, chemotaxis family, CheB/CheR fusion protein